MTALSVHVTALPEHVPDDLAARAVELLSPEERDPPAGIPGVRWREFLLSRALARAVLGRRLGCSPPDVPISRAAGGRPCLIGCETLDFNLSHSRRHCAVAVTSGGRVGVDVEEVADYPERLASRWYGSRETDWLRGLSRQDRARGFFKLWTVKEACGKARGTGIRRPLDVLAEPAAEWGEVDGLQWRTWWLSPTTVVSVAATCGSGGAPRLGAVEPAVEVLP